MSNEPSAAALLEFDDDTVDRFDFQESRWGYREVRVYQWDDGSHWALRVLVTTGDEGGIEPAGNPYRVERHEVTATVWRKADE